MRVFISYRRSDTADLAARLAAHLRAAPGVRAVFLDVEAIGAGEAFPERLSRELARADAVLVLIGPGWRGDPPTRLAEPGDHVAREIALALGSKARVIPVLVHGAAMPQAEALPEAIAGLASLNAVTLRHEAFARDADHLATLLTGKGPAARRGALRSLIAATYGLAGAAILLIGIAQIVKGTTGKALDQVLGGPGPVWVLIAAVLGAGVALPLLRRR